MQGTSETCAALRAIAGEKKDDDGGAEGVFFQIVTCPPTRLSWRVLMMLQEHRIFFLDIQRRFTHVPKIFRQF